MTLFAKLNSIITIAILTVCGLITLSTSVYAGGAGAAAPVSTKQSSPPKRKVSLKIEFNLDYVVFKKHRIPTQEVFANEICLFIATLYRRIDLNKVPSASLRHIKFYLIDVYRSTRNIALKGRIKEAIKILTDFKKEDIDIENVKIPEDSRVTVEGLGSELCMLVAVLARQQELTQANKKALSRTFLYLKNLSSQTNQEGLKQRIQFVEGYIKEELARRAALKNSAGGGGAGMPRGSGAPLDDIFGFPPSPMGREGAIPLNENNQERIQRLARLAKENLIDMNTLSPGDHQAINQINNAPMDNFMSRG